MTTPAPRPPPPSSPPPYAPLFRFRPSTRLTLHLLSLSLSLLYFCLVQHAVPLPYLDEIFHVPQTQAYCAGRWGVWDPAITTPPGLYAVPALVARGLGRMWDKAAGTVCSTGALRGLNWVLGAMGVPGLVSLLLEELAQDQRARSTLKLKTDPSPSPNPTPSSATQRQGSTGTSAPASDPAPPRRSALAHWLSPSAEAVVVAHFPLVVFFSNLFYTDLASLAGVLGAWALTLRGRHGAAALVGAWSVSVRQTNVIWLGFVCGAAVLRLLDEDGGDPVLEDWKGGLAGFPKMVKQLAGKPGQVLRLLGVYVPVFLGFGAFVAWNDGIVLGHKELHKPVLHVPQLFYFLAFCSVMLLPALIAEGPRRTLGGAAGLAVGSGSGWKIAGVVGGWGAMVALVRKYETWHPFLLADNRHYLFYVLRRVILPYRTAWHLGSPVVYLACLALWAWRVRQALTLWWTLGWGACTALALVPTPLVEPRYFLVPVMVLRIQLAGAEGARRRRIGLGKGMQEGRGKEQGRGRRQTLWAEWAWYALINAATIGLFLGRRFRWDGWDGWMRIMW